jgi:hypothetical protein
MGILADMSNSTLASQLGTIFCFTRQHLQMYMPATLPATSAKPHRPDGKIADALASTLAYTTAADAPVNYRLVYMPQRLKISHHPWETHVARCLQGGGVYVFCGTVTITYSSIYGNHVDYVRAHVQELPSPRWENC